MSSSTLVPDFITSVPCYKRSSTESDTVAVLPSKGYKRAKSQPHLPTLSAHQQPDADLKTRSAFSDDCNLWNSSLLSAESADLLQWLDGFEATQSDCSGVFSRALPLCTPEERDPPDRSGSSSSTATCMSVAEESPSDNASDDSATETCLLRPSEPFAWEADPVVHDSLRFMRTLPQACDVAPQNQALSLLPPPQPSASGRPTLLLDLDETLVHSALTATPDADFSFTVNFNDSAHLVHVQLRPGLHQFLRFVAELFEVAVFTASLQLYAEKVLDVLDPDNTLFAHRIYRDSCVFFQDGMYLKDLSRVGRDLARTAIVDNSPQVFGFQVNNGIPILSWYGDRTDSELFKLQPLLRRLAHVRDVRPVLRDYFGLAARIAVA